MNGPALQEVLEPLMTRDDKRAEMAAGARSAGRIEAADDIAGEIIKLTRQAGAPPIGETLEVAR